MATVAPSIGMGTKAPQKRSAPAAAMLAQNEPERTHQRGPGALPRNPWAIPAELDGGNDYRPLPIQRKLSIGATNDPLEAEADRVAAQVMRMPDPNLSLSSSAPVLHRKCACESSGQPCPECEKKKQETIQRKSVAADSGMPAPPIVHQVLKSSGQPLSAGVRKYMEPRFGHDLSRVRVHDGSEAAESASAVKAAAYTVGEHIVFGKGRYAPGTSEGDRLLAHELTHTIQQTGGVRLSRDPARGEDAERGTLQRALDSQSQTSTDTPDATSPDASSQDATSAGGDGGSISMAPIQTTGKPHDFEMHGKCAGLRLHGKTEGTFDGGTGQVANQKVSKGTGCKCDEGTQCVHVTGTLIIDYSVSVTITMPSMPSGLNACEQAKVQDFLDHVLAPHEQDHERRMKTYNGQTKHPVNVTGCGQDDVTAKVQAIQDAEEPARQAAAQALSDAIDPFVRSIDCSDCDKQSSANSTGQAGGDSDATVMRQASSSEQPQAAPLSIQRSPLVVARQIPGEEEHEPDPGCTPEKPYRIAPKTGPGPADPAVVPVCSSTPIPTTPTQTNPLIPPPIGDKEPPQQQQPAAQPTQPAQDTQTTQPTPTPTPNSEPVAPAQQPPTPKQDAQNGQDFSDDPLADYDDPNSIRVRPGPVRTTIIRPRASAVKPPVTDCNSLFDRQTIAQFGGKSFGPWDGAAVAKTVDATFKACPLAYVQVNVRENPAGDDPHSDAIEQAKTLEDDLMNRIGADKYSPDHYDYGSIYTVPGSAPDPNEAGIEVDLGSHGRVISTGTGGKPDSPGAEATPSQPQTGSQISGQASIGGVQHIYTTPAGPNAALREWLVQTQAAITKQLHGKNESGREDQFFVQAQYSLTTKQWTLLIGGQVAQVFQLSDTLQASFFAQVQLGQNISAAQAQASGAVGTQFQWQPVDWFAIVGQGTAGPTSPVGGPNSVDLGLTISIQVMK